MRPLTRPRAGVARARELTLVPAAAIAAACATAVVPPAGAPAPRPVASASASGPVRAAPTPEELALAGELRRDVESLAGLGERSVQKPWELAEAADRLAARIEEQGYEVGRIGYELDHVTAIVVEGVLTGRSVEPEDVVIGAHYDTVAGSPGANDGATGVAVALALAKRVRGASLDRHVRFALFPNAEPPWLYTPQMGSSVYARHLVRAGRRVRAMLALRGLGYYSDAAASQSWPRPAAQGLPTVGNFVGVVGDQQATLLIQQVAEPLSAGGRFPVEALALPGSVSWAAEGDHWPFWDLGVPAVMLTDTGVLRDPEHHGPRDLPDRLDYTRLAQIVLALERVIYALAV